MKRKSADWEERIFIDLTVEEKEVAEEVEKVIEETNLFKDQLELESDTLSEMDVLSADESMVSSENNGMNNV
jgi:hypothetical protein